MLADYLPRKFRLVTSSVSRLMTFPSLAEPFAERLARISSLFTRTALRFPSLFRAANFFLAHVVLPEAGRPRRKYAVFKTTPRRSLVSLNEFCSCNQGSAMLSKDKCSLR